MKKCLLYVFLTTLVIVYAMLWPSGLLDSNEHTVDSSENSQVVCEIPAVRFTGTIKYPFTPDKGKNLLLSITCYEGSCQVKVYKGRSTTPSKIIDLVENKATNIYEIAEKTGGESYTITITATEQSMATGMVSAS